MVSAMEGTVRHPLEWTRALVLEFRASLAGDLVRRQVRILGRKAYCFARSSPFRAQAGFGVSSFVPKWRARGDSNSSHHSFVVLGHTSVRGAAQHWAAATGAGFCKAN